MAETIFRRIGGRIVPIRVNKEEQGRAALLTGISAPTALGAGFAAARFGPKGGFAAAPKRIRKRFRFKASRGAGILALGAAAVAVNNVTKAFGFEDPSEGVASTAVLGFGLKKVGAFGRARAAAAAWRRVTKGTKFMPGAI